jgi:endonuclease IV
MRIATPPPGAHLSIAGGTWRAVERAQRLECTALQIFTQAPGQWRGRKIPEDEAVRFRHAVHEVDLGSRIDRHARIGHGRLAFDVFSRLVCDPPLASVPMVLETPTGPDEETWDREALEFLRTAVDS